mgnify:CR=1 FL=1
MTSKLNANIVGSDKSRGTNVATKKELTRAWVAYMLIVELRIAELDGSSRVGPEGSRNAGSNQMKSSSKA